MKTLALIAAFLMLAAPAMAQRQIDFRSFELPVSGSIVVPVVEGDSLTGIAAAADANTSGAISLAASEASFTGELNQTLTLYGIKPYSRIDLIGVGGDPLDRVAAENFGGLAASLNDGASGTAVRRPPLSGPATACMRSWLHSDSVSRSYNSTSLLYNRPETPKPCSPVPAGGRKATPVPHRGQ